MIALFNICKCYGIYRKDVNLCLFVTGDTLEA